MLSVLHTFIQQQIVSASNKCDAVDKILDTLRMSCRSKTESHSDVSNVAFINLTQKPNKRVGGTESEVYIV